MNLLTTFHQASNAVVIGSSGGIGGALESALREDPAIGTVLSFSRSGASDTRNGVTSRFIDITDEDSVRNAAESAADVGALDLVIVASGILHNGSIRPEKSMRDIEGDSMLDVLRINTVGPALVAKHFLPLLRPASKTVFAALSARVGSIGDNRLGGWMSYRASKSALNMLLKTLSIEHARKQPKSIVVALHPGTVDTMLSKPFQKNVPIGRLFTADYAAMRLLHVIDGLRADETGSFFAWDGQAIPY